MIAGNFLIDSAVVLLTLYGMHHDAVGSVWKKCIGRVVLSGFICDLIGSLLNTLLWFTLLDPLDTWMIHRGLNPYNWPGCVLTAAPAVMMAAIALFILNRRWSFGRTDLRKDQIRRLALNLAIFTAPWVMLVPLDVWTSIFAVFGLA